MELVTPDSICCGVWGGDVCSELREQSHVETTWSVSFVTCAPKLDSAGQCWAGLLWMQELLDTKQDLNTRFRWWTNLLRMLRHVYSVVVFYIMPVGSTFGTNVRAWYRLHIEHVELVRGTRTWSLASFVWFVVRAHVLLWLENHFSAAKPHDTQGWANCTKAGCLFSWRQVAIYSCLCCGLDVGHCLENFTPMFGSPLLPNFDYLHQCMDQCVCVSGKLVQDLCLEYIHLII